jgi:hypothetical protein
MSMTRLLLSLAAALLSLALAPAAHAQIPQGGFTSDGVEFVKNFAGQFDTAGGVLHQGHYYITTERDLTIYDVKDPANPVQTGKLQFPEVGEPIFTEEDPNTNGKILPVENAGVLMVIDVTDKAAPKILSTLPMPAQHTISCVLDCTWIYGSEGAIVDLRDPKAPKLSAKTLISDNNHDVTEVKPGLVLTSSDPAMLLDATKDPESPTVLAETKMPGFTHANLWPHQATDDFALIGGEATGPGCSEDASATFQTWDTRTWQADKSFSLISQFKMATGVPAQGASPETTYCVHWFDPHPTYANGGLVSIAWYEHGVRFLQVGTDGKLSEIGWYVPLAGQSSDVDWISNDIVYVADYLRGLDVLRYTGTVPQGRGANLTPASPGNPPAATPTTAPTTTTPPAGPGFDRLVTLPSAKRCAKAKSFKVKVRKASDPVTALELRVNGKKVLTVKGSKLKKAIKVRKLPRKKKFSVQVTVKTKSGYRTAGQRNYKGC